MKEKILFFGFILVFSLSSYSQTKDSAEKRYYYNFSEKRLYKDVGYTKVAFAPLKYKAGRDINIEIKHFNPLQYEVIIEESSSNYFLNDTAKWSSRIVIPSIPNTPSGAPIETTAPKAVANIEKRTGNVEIEAYALNVTDIIKEKISPCQLIQDAINDLNEKKVDLQQRILDYKNLVIAIETINNTFDNLKALPELTTTNVRAELLNSFIAPLNVFLTAQGSVVINTDPTLVYSGNLGSKEEESYKLITDKFDEIQQIKTDVEARVKGSPSCTDFAKLYKEFRDNFDAIRKALNDFSTSRSEHLVQFKNTTALYDKLKRYAIADPEIVTSAITIEKDLHTISIKTKTGTAQPTVYDNIHLQPTRGVKVDVATGFFFSNLSDKSFFKHSMDSIHHKNYLANGLIRDTIVQESYTAIYEKQNARLSFGGMIFLQAHSQNPGNWNGGGYLGFGALFNDQARWSGSAGGTLLIGQKQRFNINAGLILSQVDRLSPPYKTEVSYREAIDNIPTYRAWKAGIMLGFSWNF